LLNGSGHIHPPTLEIYPEVLSPIMLGHILQRFIIAGCAKDIGMKIGAVIGKYFDDYRKAKKCVFLFKFIV